MAAAPRNYWWFGGSGEPLVPLSLSGCVPSYLALGPPYRQIYHGPPSSLPECSGIHQGMSRTHNPPPRLGQPGSYHAVKTQCGRCRLAACDGNVAGGLLGDSPPTTLQINNLHCGRTLSVVLWRIIPIHHPPTPAPALLPNNLQLQLMMNRPPNDESSQLSEILSPQKKNNLKSQHPKTSNNDVDIAFTEWETELNFLEKKYQHSKLWCVRDDRP
uniref:(California timema) hypothetical protein n=1 Tax=Timema californicum TaxID=61474 RepID=A0A7R9J8N0_TIMCA|nr:unnamed protein product [Timema californicum]